MAETKTVAVPNITYIDGCLLWPSTPGGIIRIDPFHIKAFGLSPGSAPTSDGGAAISGFFVWVDIGAEANYLAFYQDKAKALAQFVTVQQAKMRH